MASVSQNFMKLFRGSSGGTQAQTPQTGQKPTRRSSGLGELSRVWNSESPLCVLDQDTLEMERVVVRREARRGPTGAVHTAIGDGFRLQRVFNNRHIETLFRDFASIKFFLARDNVREVLVVR